MNNLAGVGKIQDSIGTINMYDDDFFMDHDFVQVDEESIFIRSKNNTEIDQLLPETEPIENNLMNTVDDKNNFNTENSKTSNKQNTAYMISENNFAIPNTLNQQY